MNLAALRSRDRNLRRGVGALAGLTLLVVGFTVLVFFLGRQVESRASVRTAADSAAQAAARQRDPTAADAAARQTAADMLGDTSTCAGGPTVVVDLSDFRPGGIVSVDITCTTGNDDLAAVAAPSRTCTGHGAAVIDTYRAGTP